MLAIIVLQRQSCQVGELMPLSSFRKYHKGKTKRKSKMKTLLLLPFKILWFLIKLPFKILKFIFGGVRFESSNLRFKDEDED